MYRISALLSALLLISSAHAQDTAANQDVPLSDDVRLGLEGDWVGISEQTVEQIERSVGAYCNVDMIDNGGPLTDWRYDEETYETTKPVLDDVRGTLAFRFNGPDDLFIAHIPTTAFGGEIEFTRAIGLKMDMNGGLVGVRYEITNDKSPATTDPTAVPWLRYSMTMYRSQNQNTGEYFYFLSFPKGPGYEDVSATQMFVRCP